MRRARVATLALLALLPPGCGTLSRDVNARRAAHARPESQGEPGTRGADPFVASLWIAAAHQAPDPAAALAIVERGLAYLPGQPDLSVARLALLATLDRRDEQVAAARRALAAAPAPELEAELRWYLVDAALAAGRREEAALQARALGGVSRVAPPLVAGAWAQIALESEFAGAAEDADEAFDASLAWGPAGLSALREAVALAPDRSAAQRALVERAALRQPDHADLIIARAVDALMLADHAEAERRLQELPEPLPERLEQDAQLVRARIALSAGRHADCLRVVRERLDAHAADPAALVLLLELRRVAGLPDAAEARERLGAARRLVGDPRLARFVDAGLAELGAD